VQWFSEPGAPGSKENKATRNLYTYVQSKIYDNKSVQIHMVSTTFSSMSVGYQW